MDLGLKGKIAVVAGASKGLGFGVARSLAAEGAIVSMASRESKAIQSAAERIKQETGGTVYPVVADLRNAASIEKWVGEVGNRHGGVDLLFSNTGGPPAGAVLGLSDDAWISAHELLLLSAVRLARAVVPRMRQKGKGSIVFSTSVSIKEPNPTLALSNVERAGVATLAKTLSTELAPLGIRVNCVVPGRIETDRVRELDELKAGQEGTTAEEQKRKNEKLIPLGRYGKVAEYADPTVFLLSDAASYITGATLLIDGGLVRSVQ